MADERLTDQPEFAGSEIQDTDVMWIDVDNGDTTFTSYKISGAQLKDLLDTNIYNNDGAIDETRNVVIDDDTGELVIASTLTTHTHHPSFIQIRHLDSGTPDDVRTITLSSANMSVISNNIQYTNTQVYTKQLVTLSDVPVVMQTFTPTTASNFAVMAEVKGYSTAGNTFHYTKITATYKLVSGVATLVGAAQVYNPAAAGMAVALVPNAATVELQVTGLSGDITTWNSWVKVF